LLEALGENIVDFLMTLVKVGKNLRQLRFHRILIQVHDTRKEAEHTGIDFLSCKRLHNQRRNKRPQKNAAGIWADHQRKSANS
jgi:hypothetical protein